MAHKIDGISLYTPGNCTPEFLERTLVKKELADKLKDYIEEGITGKSKQSFLIVGARGTGKSHLLAVLFSRISETEELKDKVTIAYLKEEEHGVATFLDWLVRMLKSLIWRNEDAKYVQQELENLFTMSPRDAEKRARQLLIDYVGERTLLVITENLNDIFSNKKGMGKRGQEKFRDLVQEEPFWVILASSKMLFEEVQKGDAPFYGFFKVYHLNNLTLEEAFRLLSNIANYEKNREVADFLLSAKGRGRIRAVHEVTGGNARLLVFFYRFINRESISKVEEEFMRMVEDLTSYYQEKMTLLSSQQSKIVEFLAEHRKPANVKTIARNCFITHQTAASQLKKLLGYNYVGKIDKGRESYYELTEPLFRVCFEVKANKGKPISLFMDFLEGFYTVEELKKQYEVSKILRCLYESEGITTRICEVSRELELYEQIMMRCSLSEKQNKDISIFKSLNEIRSKELLIEELFKREGYKAFVQFYDDVRKYRTPEGRIREKGLEALKRNKDWERCVEEAKELLQKKPNDIKGLLLKADAFLELEKYENAEQCYKKILTLEEKNENALRGLANVYYKNEEIESAKSKLNEILELNQDDEKAWNLLGVLKFQQEEYDEALKCFKKVTEINPDFAQGWSNLASTQKHLEYYVKARESYKKAIELESENYKFPMLLGILEEDQGNYEKAEEYLRKTITLKPSEAIGWATLGTVQIHLNRFKEARKSFHKAVELEPGNHIFLLNLGIFEENSNQHEDALKYFKKVTELKPNEVHGWIHLAQVQEKLQKFEEARASYKQALSLESENQDLLMGIGILECKLRNFEKAENYFKKITEIHPETAGGWNNLGNVQEKLKRFEEARKSYLKAVTIDPSDYRLFSNLGIFEFEQDRFEESERYFKKAVELKQDFPETWCSLGVVQKHLKKYEKSRKNFKRAIELEPNNYGFFLDLAHLEVEAKNYSVVDDLLKKSEELFLADEKKIRSFYNNKGEILQKMGMLSGALEAYEIETKTKPDHICPYYNIVLTYFEMEKHKQGLSRLKKAIKASSKDDCNEKVPYFFEKLNHHLLENISFPKLKQILSDEFTLCQKHNFIEPFADGYGQALFSLLKEDSEVEIERLKKITAINEELFSDCEKLTVATKLFKLGVQYLEEKTKKAEKAALVLLQLPKEERKVLTDILGIQEI